MEKKVLLKKSRPPIDIDDTDVRMRVSSNKGANRDSSV